MIKAHWAKLGQAVYTISRDLVAAIVHEEHMNAMKEGLYL